MVKPDFKKKNTSSQTQKMQLVFSTSYTGHYVFSLEHLWQFTYLLNR